jgi:hypothetical protein
MQERFEMACDALIKVVHHGYTLLAVNGIAGVITVANVANGFKYAGWIIAAGYGAWKWRTEYLKEKRERLKEENR